MKQRRESTEKQIKDVERLIKGIKGLSSPWPFYTPAKPWPKPLGLFARGDDYEHLTTIKRKLREL